MADHMQQSLNISALTRAQADQIRGWADGRRGRRYMAAQSEAYKRGYWMAQRVTPFPGADACDAEFSDAPPPNQSTAKVLSLQDARSDRERPTVAEYIGRRQRLSPNPDEAA